MKIHDFLKIFVQSNGKGSDYKSDEMRLMRKKGYCTNYEGINNGKIFRCCNAITLKCPFEVEKKGNCVQ